MSRRSRKKNSNSNSSTILVGSIAGIAAIAAGFVILNQSETPTAKRFPLESYISNGNSLRGSEYNISGEIVENAQHNPAVGKFVLIKVDTGDQPISPDLPNSVGILVPADVNGPNLETKQNYSFVVDVRKEGALVATSYTAK